MRSHLIPKADRGRDGARARHRSMVKFDRITFYFLPLVGVSSCERRIAAGRLGWGWLAVGLVDPHPCPASRNAALAKARPRKGEGNQGADFRIMLQAAPATRMQTGRRQLDRLLDPSDASVTLATLRRAAQAVVRKVEVELV